MKKIENKTLIPMDGSVEISFTRGGSVVADGEVIPGRYSFEAGHPQCNPNGMCIMIH